ncbi:MAG: uroporphyrinogen decarboxylase family protein [Candidatus Marinimicrobia bacterium]|nr:uroporphyrinogen decarboxylase family protein [Candidatus Neomarinimicrobiota bacterium]MCF7840789.1 uroporphyrinogen decarboxylase family protein [Candidatus Neomarinimicrobiota bacterium]MCF7902687.1 uroporphyrinogen decarboxylase family protein [Candidatus Neomarinimicrobiota bacterium]
MPTHLLELTNRTYEQKRRLVVPLLGFPGVRLCNTSIKIAQQNVNMHVRVLEALYREFKPDALFPLMDLSVEANALGRYVDFPTDDSSTVPAQPFDFEELNQLEAVDLDGDGRVWAYAETVRKMRQRLPSDVLMGAYVTGPYTLAALINGAENTALATLTRPDELRQLCEIATDNISKYVQRLISAGADMICILEPSAVMLGPNEFEAFSARYIRKLATVCQDRNTPVILHICGDTRHLIPSMAAIGVDALSLDSPANGINLPSILEQVNPSTVLIGNVDPVQEIVQGTPESIREAVQTLLEGFAGKPNFILSTGCDIPLEASLENIHSFMKAGRCCS